MQWKVVYYVEKTETVTCLRNTHLLGIILKRGISRMGDFRNRVSLAVF